MIVYNAYIKYLAFAAITVSLPIIALIILKIIQKLSAGKVKSLVCLVGKTAIVTGGCSGIGFETALVLASRGCRVILADRSDGARAKKKIIEITHNTNIETKHLDLASLQSVRKFANDINGTEERLDILINNATVGAAGSKHTDDGLNAAMQINHFGPFLLTHLLTDLLKKSAPSLTSNSLHPGLVYGDLPLADKHMISFNTLINLARVIVLMIYGKSEEEGAQTTIHLALSNKVKNITGKHFWDCRMFPPPPGAWNSKFCDAIWKKSEELVHLKPEEKL
ncbi:hypothetical protein NQ317_017409 [Molorchus minor]|uniref:Retinol dehydrogenase 11 n=1 Tax=Molorchus minor TaxID=1323400 RepID=A0ABQ9JIB0_9CUCU|nr:hypothetical protein NQ317_017409 [Molorchus minor]